MTYLHRKYCSILLFALLSAVTCAQTIDELEVIPADPISPSDSVSIVASTIFPYSNCLRESFDIQIDDDTVFVKSIHNMGLAAAICYSTDTLNLGVYEPGTYTVSYELLITGFNEILESADTSYTEFTVQGVNNVSNSFHNPVFHAFPNPSTSHLFIETDLRENASIFSLLGKRVKAFYIDKSPYKLSTEDLSPGIYLLTSDGASGLKFLVR